MKKQKYDIEKIYQKLISDEIPQSYVDFIVSNCVTTCQANAENRYEQETPAVTASQTPRKRYGFFGKK